VNVKAELENAERPDVAIRLAFEHSTDRKAVIRQAASAARYIRGSRIGIALVSPWPTPYEAVDLWSGNADSVSRALSYSRSLMIATIIGAPLTYSLDRFVMGTWFARLGLRYSLQLALLFIVVIVLASIIRAAIAASVRRTAARLDEQSALEGVLELIADGAKRSPKRAQKVMAFLRLNLPDHVR
jgi:hypothetical protein